MKMCTSNRSWKLDLAMRGHLAWRGVWGALGVMALALGGAGCKDEGEKIPAPGPLLAGVAKGRIPAPVGIGTVGYGGFGVAGPESPFNGRYYPATNRVHGHPEYRALVISRGAPHEVIFLRADTVGVFQHFRRAVALELEARLGYSVEDRFVFGGTHTHSGPGRIIDAGPIYDLMADTFFPEHYLRMVNGAADVVMAAYADLGPARIGHAWASAPDGHNDRRCEDGLDYTNDDVPLLAVEREGRIEALLYAYSVHGTVLGIEDFTLSREVSGAIEAFVEAGFDHPVVALGFNSWGADMSPGSPDVTLQPGGATPEGYERLLRVGSSVAGDIHAALAGIAWEEEPEIFAEVHRIPIGREAIGYPAGMFEYEWGGVYCSFADGDDCDPATTIDDLDSRCVPFPDTSPLPNLTEIAAGRVGLLAFVTVPGEPGTLLAEELLGRLASLYGQDDVMFLGYTMDYTGYAILEDDWWQGGYEASGHIWGPWQGEYLVDRASEVFAKVVVDGPRAGRLPDEPPPAEPFGAGEYTPYEPTEALEVGTFAVDASALYGEEDVVVVTVYGEDPWLGVPLATLEDETGEPVLGPNGVPVDSDGYAFWVDVAYDPPYEEDEDAATRHFRWTFSMPVQLTVSGLLPELAGGSYRLRVTLPGEGAAPQEVLSAVFAVE